MVTSLSIANASDTVEHFLLDFDRSVIELRGKGTSDSDD